jgi:hypothetical protein
LGVSDGFVALLDLLSLLGLALADGSTDSRTTS